MNLEDPREIVFVFHTGCSWSELTRKLELWVEIHELNEQGEYMAVEVSPKPEVPSGGVFQLRQVSTLKCFHETPAQFTEQFWHGLMIFLALFKT